MNEPSKLSVDMDSLQKLYKDKLQELKNNPKIKVVSTSTLPGWKEHLEEMDKLERAEGKAVGWPGLAGKTSSQ